MVTCTTTGRTSSTYILYAHNELTTVLSPLGQANYILLDSTLPSYGTVGTTPRQTQCVCVRACACVRACVRARGRACVRVWGSCCGTYRDNDIQLRCQKNNANIMLLVFISVRT